MQPQDPELSKWGDHFEKAETVHVFLSGDGHDDDDDDIHGDMSEMRGTLSVNVRLSLMIWI